MRKVSLAARGMLAACWLAILAGCATTPKTSGEWPPPRPNLSSLQPGDVLEIKFPYWPDLNEEQAIRPDGRIALQHLGDVEVAGRTPEEVHQDLLTRYAAVLRKPELNVAVKSYASQQVYVGGEVQKPGAVPIQGGRLTLADAIFQSGGFVKESARLKSVIVVRQRDGKQYARALDLKRVLNGQQSEPFNLEPYDIVYVPRTKIDRVNQWVDKYINKVIPDKFVFTFNRNLDNQGTTARTNASTLNLSLPTAAK